MKPIEIQHRLNTLFQTNPLVIWNDPGAEFADMLVELDLPGVEVVSDVEGDRFALKSTLNGLPSHARLLVYRPAAIPAESDWLADATTYAPIFAADRTTLLLDELNARDTREMRDAVASFAGFLSTAGHLRRIRGLRARYETPYELALAVMATALGRDTSADAEAVIIAYLCRAHAEGADRVWSSLKRSGVARAFAQLLSDCLGYTGDPADADGIAAHILLSTLASYALSGLPKPVDDALTLRHSADVARFWMRIVPANTEAREALMQAASSLESTYDLEGHLRGRSIAELLDIPLLPLVDALLIRRLIAELCSPSPDVATLRTAIDQRRTGLWADAYHDCYAALDAALALRAFARCHHDPLAQDDAAAVWHAYTTDWACVDTAYRHFHLAFARLRLSAPHGLDAPFYDLATQLENWYCGYFLPHVSATWERTASTSFAHDGFVSGVPQLGDFYLTHVDALARKKRHTWVIISDALRYEVAHELANALEASTQGQTSLTSMQAPFPSITLCGMAALLPHDRYQLSCTGTSEHRTLAATVDGMPTQSTNARNDVLNAYLATHQPGAQGLTIQTTDFIRMNKEERKRAVGDAAVIYLYHNRIDATGDDATTEDDVFRACADTIGELSQLVSLIVRDFRASDILITADHGFLYTYRPLAETDKIATTEITGTIVEQGRRYVVGDRNLSSAYMLPVSLDLVSNGKLSGLCPHKTVRLKKAGGGSNYVHGGISLQEICVPVIHFKNFRSGMRGYAERSFVGLSLVTPLSAVTNLTCSLEVLQDGPVGGKTLPATYELLLQTEDGDSVSDTAVIRADRTDADATKRVFPATLHVRSTYLGKCDIPCQLIARRIGSEALSTADPERIVLAMTRLQIAFAPEEENAWWL